MSALLALGLGLAGIGLLVWLKWCDARAWARTLVRYELGLPRDLSADAVTSWLAQVAAITRPSGFSVIAPPALVLEREATARGITFFLLVPKSRQSAVLASLRAALPNARVTEPSHATDAPPRFTSGLELRNRPPWFPLADQRAEAAVTGSLATLQPLPAGVTLRVQAVLSGVRGGPSAPLAASLLGGRSDDPKRAKAWQLKQRHPLLGLAVRVAVSGPAGTNGYGLVHRVTGALRVLETAETRLVRTWHPGWLVARRVMRPALPWSSWPVLANTAEAVGLVGLPVGGPSLPGLALGGSRVVPLPVDMPRRGLVIGESTYPGTPRPLVLTPDDRLRHLYLLGPTGVGKSALIANMALQDITAGSGVVVVDPKSDLVDDIITRIPAEHLDRVVVLDAANTARPVGFNPLRAGGSSEHQRELAAESTVHILHNIFKAYWGPRTDDLLRATLLSLVAVPAPDGTAFTLAEVPELLTNAQLRHYVMSHPRLDPRWREYWQWYDGLGEGERLATIGPVLNKLRAFTHRTSLRLVLGQSGGLDLAEVFTKRKVLLVPLGKGEIGPEAATLLGSLLVGSLWQATLARSGVSAERRRPAWAYLDEFQDVVRLTDDVPDVLAQARGLGLGLTLAHQFLKQVPDSTRAAVLGTARSHVYFQVEQDDARALEPRVAPALTAADLTGLGRYEVAARLSVHGQTRSPVTGRTLALPEPLRNAASTRAELAERYGTDRADVEAALEARRQSVKPPRIGSVPLPGGDD